MTWVPTGDEASDITGRTITDAQVAVARPIIEVFSGVVEDQSDKLRVKDLRMLQYATAYQAAWLAANPGAVVGMDVQSATQDSVSFTRFNDGNDDAAVLAPLARRCLDRLSWRRTKSVQSRSPWDLVDLYADDFVAQWRPLGPLGRR